jgi:hypothetical protein
LRVPYVARQINTKTTLQLRQACRRAPARRSCGWGAAGAVVRQPPPPLPPPPELLSMAVQRRRGRWQALALQRSAPRVLASGAGPHRVAASSPARGRARGGYILHP